MEKLDITKMSDLGSTLTLASLVKKSKGSIFNVPEWEPPNSFMVEIKVNGVEISFSEMLKRLEGAFERYVKKEGKNLFQEKIRDLEDIIYDKFQGIEKEIEGVMGR